MIDSSESQRECTKEKSVDIYKKDTYVPFFLGL